MTNRFHRCGPPRDPARLPPVNVHVRWMIRRDHDDVLALAERAALADDDHPIDHEYLIEAGRLPSVVACVAESLPSVESPCAILGFVVYGLHKRRLEILSLVVDPAWRRRRIGTQLVGKLSGKLSVDGRRRLGVTVRDVDLVAHLFLRGRGFRAREVLRDEFGPGVDGYRFAYAPFDS